MFASSLMGPKEPAESSRVKLYKNFSSSKKIFMDFKTRSLPLAR